MLATDLDVTVIWPLPIDVWEQLSCFKYNVKINDVNNQLHLRPKHSGPVADDQTWRLLEVLALY